MKMKVTTRYSCTPIRSVNLKFKISVLFDVVSSFLGVCPVGMKALVWRDTRTGDGSIEMGKRDDLRWAVFEM